MQQSVEAKWYDIFKFSDYWAFFEELALQTDRHVIWSNADLHLKPSFLSYVVKVWA